MWYAHEGTEIGSQINIYQHCFPFLKALTSMLASFTGLRRSSLGFEGLEIILDDLPFARAPAAVTAPPEGPR